MAWPFGPSGSPDGSKDDDEAKKQRGSWMGLLGPLQRDPFAAAREWAPMVLFSLVGLGALQLYANYLRRIPGADYVRPSFFRSRSLFGRVTSVGDGDGFHMFHTPGGRAAGWGWLRRVPDTRKELRDRTITIRLAGVDAPEGAHFGRPAQPFAAESLVWLSDYLMHRNVRAYVYRRDQYSRIIATVYVRRFLIRRDVGLEMVKCGLATTYEAKFGAEFGGMRAAYEKAQAKAKKKRKGMWASKPSKFESPREYKTRWGGQQDKTGT
ncbi:hypothetical protein G6O67_007069 [Ophiocordyceps sinensis]|uniref:Probable endonuclease LCL3 n=2 Tax=Ophiocordyceps sinensis TaxID=72228 RepID=A0A8H4LTJ4_9HYPO|nr:nuclease domain containing protein [Ophiocordyceps sinensis CO18]KAF4505085.1 hypothetical protein G6O67_007069 [Ophiocordyceps sinensis]